MICSATKQNRRITHGLGKTKLWAVWCSMKSRCLSPTHRFYARYGGRGITVCPAWVDYANFHAWAISNGYREGLTIDRIDNDAGYSPYNCRWVDRKVQNNNKSDNVVVEFAGRRMTLMLWAEELKMNYHTLWSRLHRGWTVERAFSTPRVGSRES